MKTTSLLFLLIALLFNIDSFSQRAKEYEDPALAEIIVNHKTVAILPFQYTLTYKKLPKGMTQEDVQRDERESGASLQTSMHSWLLRKSDKYSVEFQDPRKTNALLTKAGIDENNIFAYEMNEIAEILEVDGILSGEFKTDKPMNTGGAVALQIFTGFSARTNESDGYITLHDGKSGDLIWKYAKEVGGSLGSSADDTIDRIMKKVSKRFPYDKDYKD